MRRALTAQALLWFTLALPLFISVAGLAIDGGLLVSSRRELQSVADGAARAGATRLDLVRLRDSGGADVELDPTLAVSTARAYLAERLPAELSWQATPSVQVEGTGRSVHVAIDATMPTAFLRIIHIDRVPVAASAFANVEYGIHGGSGD